jgi:hypothetical protein
LAVPSAATAADVTIAPSVIPAAVNQINGLAEKAGLS